MPRDLAAVLVEEGAVSAADLQRAQARQHEAGGALDTALLELGLLDEERLVELLTRATELPAAPPGAYAAADLRARRVFPSRVAERHGLAPFALDGKELSLVATCPVDLGLLDEISFMLSLHLAPHIGPEFRVRELIRQLYGTVLPPRLAALVAGGAALARKDLPLEGAAGAPAAGYGAVAHAAPPGPPPTPAPQGFAQEAPDALEPLMAALAQALEAGELPFLAEPVAGPDDTPAPAFDRSAPPRWSVDQARAALAAARSRDEVVLAALRYARDFLEYAALFAVTRDAVVGHDALGPEEDARDRCRATAIYASDPGIFRTVIETRAAHLGPMALHAAGNQVILSGLGRGRPRTVLVHPVLLRDRPVALLYADNGEAPVSARRLGDLLLLLSQVGNAFERILRERKARRATSLPPSPPVAAGPPAPAKPHAPTPPPSPGDALRARGGGEGRMEVAGSDASGAVTEVSVEAASLGKESGSDAAPQVPAAAPLEVDIDVTEPEPPGRVPEAAPAIRSVGAAPAAAPFDPAAEVDTLVASAPGSDARARAIAGIIAHPAVSAPVLCARLPGPIEVTPPAADTTPAWELGPIPAALAALGAAAVAPLVQVLEDRDAQRRRIAAELLGHIGEPAAFGPLAERVLDSDARVAAAARAGLAAHRRDPALRPVPEKLRRALLSGLGDRPARAAQALGELRDAESIPVLIQVLEASDAAGAKAAADALARITLQRLGTGARKWLHWWKQNRGKGRADWLFSGLTSADRQIRVAAASELREVAPSPVAYSVDLPPAEREKAARAWASWFARSGQIL